MWEDAKRASHTFINDDISMGHIDRNSHTLRYTYSYTLTLYDPGGGL